MPRRNALQHCLHVFKFADRVHAINLIHFRTRVGLSRSDSLYRPRFEVLSVKCFARVTVPGRTFARVLAATQAQPPSELTMPSHAATVTIRARHPTIRPARRRRIDADPTADLA